MPPSYPKHAATLAWAAKQIGQHEIPAGSNTGTFVLSCQRATWLAGTCWAWCRAFSLKAHQEGGFTLPDGSAGAWDALGRARKRGDSLGPSAYRLVIPGDEVIWAFGAGHCSIYTGSVVRNGVVYIQSIDGNVADQVERCERPLSQVKGFIHWQEHSIPDPGKPVKRQVVGSISGKRQLVTKSGHVIPLPAKKPPTTLGVIQAIPKDAIIAKPKTKVPKAAKPPKKTTARRGNGKRAL